MQKLVLVAAFSLITALSGCMATQYASHKGAGSSQTKIAFSDNLLAIAKPSTPIKAHPTALVMAGERHNYLVEGHLLNDKKSMTDIFTHLNLNDLHIEKLGTIQKHANHYISTVDLRYIRPKQQVSAQEEQVINAVQGAKCHTSNNEGSQALLSCKLPIWLNIIPISKPANQTLQHRFKTPIKADFYETHTSTSSKALMPLAILVDIVTLPIQVVGATLKIANNP